MSPSGSIIIPAHNEERVIGRLLDSLAPAMRSGEFEVHVVCNGCTDNTARIASQYLAAQVHCLEQASKIAALNYGDEKAGDCFPRLYLDADIAVDLPAVRAVIEVLRSGQALAAAPKIHVVLEGRPRVVRGFYETFLRTPWMTCSPIGSGFYGLSAQGRSRFGSFPEVINDDLFIRELFDEKDRISVADARFQIEAPMTVRALVRAKARVAAGTQEYVAASTQAQRIPDGRKPLPSRIYRFTVDRLRSPLTAMARDPALWTSLASYLGIRSAAWLLSTRQRLLSARIEWAQDRTTRL